MAEFDSAQLRQWAARGAEQRLLEIAAEAAAIYQAFPELRDRSERHRHRPRRLLRRLDVADAATCQRHNGRQSASGCGNIGQGVARAQAARHPQAARRREGQRDRQGPRRQDARAVRGRCLPRHASGSATHRRNAGPHAAPTADEPVGGCRIGDSRPAPSAPCFTLAPASSLLQPPVVLP